MTKLITLVGECNPYNADERYALYPHPERSAGGRLCRLILGMRITTYVSKTERINLVVGPWSESGAKYRAASLMAVFRRSKPRVVLLGAKVCRSFGVPYDPFSVVKNNSILGDTEYLVLPHPSGLCRIWNEDGSYKNARDAVAAFCPDISPLLGVPDDETAD